MSRPNAVRRRPPEPEAIDPEWEEPAFDLEVSEALPPVLRADESEPELDDSEVREVDRTPCVDPVSAPQRALIELFASRAELRFPGVDAKVLEARAASVRALAEEVERARDRLARAEAELTLGRKALGALAEQAHEYARIFGRSDPELTTALEAIVLREETKRRRRDGAPEAPKTPKRRGRPPKTTAVELPFAAS
ncbi:MAG: hypothetical protein MUE69_28445 [Myxococcota bacterium]|jgi:hypothetical protein|nr:hypothetical protein [Myxococcota bacterium]